MPLTKLNAYGCRFVDDLKPLQGMKLTSLNLVSTPVRDLTPLASVSLVEIWFTPAYVKQGIDVLRQMESLKSIVVGSNQAPLSREEFFKRYDAGEFKK